MGSSKLKRARVRVGPPQNCDISSKKKTPPQQTLQKIEKQMHKLSRGIALERVITVPGARKYGPDPGEEEGKSKKGKKSKVDDVNKKSHYDEFDKILGLQSKTANPVLRITSSFLGPLMRMIRIFLYITRVSFNMATWRDPYFSFWILCFLVAQTIILLIFPWRPFLFISSFLCLGPQVRGCVFRSVNCSESGNLDDELYSKYAFDLSLLDRIFLYANTLRRKRLKRPLKKLKRCAKKQREISEDTLLP